MLAASAPALLPQPFAASAIGGTIRTIPNTTADSTAASLALGFPIATFTPIPLGGTPPNGEDFNGILNWLSSINQWFQAGGVPIYNAAFSTAIGGYPKGAVLESFDYDGFWISTVENNTSNPDTGGANWTLFSFSGSVKPGTLIPFAGVTVPAGTLASPTTLTYVSATTYSALAFAIGSTWGGASSINAGSFVIGNTYVIETVGTTDFTLIGATANTVGVTFTATGIGAGTGNAWSAIGLPFFPTGYVPVAGTVGTLTHGALLAHTHNIPANGSGSSGFPASGSGIGTIATNSVGGTDNLAAGYGVQWCVKY